MKVIIAGSRGIKHLAAVTQAIEESEFDVTEVVSGCASGVDQLGEQWAELHKVHCTFMPADWSRGKHAGLLRNEKMADYADALIAVWDGQSKGTQHMINTAYEKGLAVFVFQP